MSDSAIHGELKAKFPGLYIEEALGGPMAVVKKEQILEVCRWLREKGFDMLMDLTCVDYQQWEEKENRFEVIYNVYSLSRNERVMLKAPVSEADCTIDSVTGVWAAANWYEREVWDMFGVRFKGHPNLKRILMYDDFKGHALRKDYPYNFRQPQIGPKN